MFAPCRQDEDRVTCPSPRCAWRSGRERGAPRPRRTRGRGEEVPGYRDGKVSGPEDPDVLVTKAAVHAATRSSLEEAGVEVVVAGKVQA